MLENKVPGELEFQLSSSDMPEQVYEFTLTPSPAEKEMEGVELVLEAESIARTEEITFDGEAESEARIEEAMKAYDNAMNEAAGM